MAKLTAIRSLPDLLESDGEDCIHKFIPAIQVGTLDRTTSMGTVTDDSMRVVRKTESKKFTRPKSKGTFGSSMCYIKGKIASISFT